MSDIEPLVTCAEHGQRQGAFVCQHLVSGSGLGFCWAEDPENPDQQCPDAWCDSCNVALDEAGEWNERTLAMADIKLVCDLCYEQIRERNWRQDEDKLDQLLREATSFLEEKQEQLQKDFRIGEYERYDWNQDSGQLIFSHKGKPRVVADIVFVGSVSTVSDTWLWSWANDSNLEPVKARMREVRQYGQDHNLLKLATAHWRATQQDGWEMTAVAAFLLGAVGAYRSPKDGGFTFMVMTRVDWAQ
jgi:hypothetical protein